MLPPLSNESDWFRPLLRELYLRPGEEEKKNITKKNSTQYIDEA